MEITDITEEIKPTQVLLKNTSAEFCLFASFTFEEVNWPTANLRTITAG